MSVRKKIARHRFLILGIGASFTLLLGFLYVSDRNIFSFHRICPLSPICTAYIHHRPGIPYLEGLFIFIFLAVTALFVRRLFCSTLCPIGFLSDLLNKLGRLTKIPDFSRKYNLTVLSRISRSIFLLLTIFAPFVILHMFFQHLCPISLSGDLIYTVETTLAWTMLSLLVILSLFISRFFCRFLCPLGLLFGIMGKIGYRIFPSYSILLSCGHGFSCKKCMKNCPTAVVISSHATVINDIDCIQCGNCTRLCPVHRKKAG